MLKSETLKKAKELIKDPEKWGKYSYGRDANGMDGFWGYEEGVCKRCAVGAIYGAVGDHSGGAYVVETFVDDVVDASDRGRRSTTGFNDDEDTTHQDVMDLFDEAIEAALSEESRGQ